MLNELNGVVVTVTKKGQATIPKSMREKHRIGRKVLAVDSKAGVMLIPLPDPSSERGSLKSAFKGRSSTDIVRQARRVDFEKEIKLNAKAVRNR